MRELSRRAFVRTAALAVGGAAFARGGAAASAPEDPGWAQAAAIVARIKAPVFADREFDVTRYGAKSEGSADATAAIRAAIDACARAGGGRVRVPAGRFLTGPLHLRSGVNLHLDAGATLAFVQDPRAYLPHVLTRFEGV